MPATLDRLARLAARREAAFGDGPDPFDLAMERVLSATEAVIGGRRTILVGTNNYLGLSFDPGCIEAARAAAAEQGTGTTGSRMANGTYLCHRALEQRLARLFGRRSATLFTTGYQANLGVLTALAGPGDTLLIDADSHASIYDGAALSGATVVRYRHNDPADLDKRLGRIARTGKETILVVAEGIYSMCGDRPPLAALIEVKRRHGALLVLDEAHSFGVLGEKGRGLAESLGCEADIDLLVGTFSKSVGTVGGFCVSDHPGLDLLRYVSRPYIFTASLPPPIVAAACVALDRIEQGGDLRRRLWANIHAFHDGLRALGLEVMAEPGPVAAVRLPDQTAAIGAWRALLEGGVYVNLAMPPATPQGVFLLRCSLSAAHTQAQIDRVLDAFAAVLRRFGQPAPA